MAPLQLYAIANKPFTIRVCSLHEGATAANSVGNTDYSIRVLDERVLSIPDHNKSMVDESKLLVPDHDKSMVDESEHSVPDHHQNVVDKSVLSVPDHDKTMMDESVTLLKNEPIVILKEIRTVAYWRNQIMTTTKLLHQKPKIQKGKMFPVILSLSIIVLFNNFQ